MKILYCLQSTCNSGGMERILSIKANFLSENLGYDVIDRRIIWLKDNGEYEKIKVPYIKNKIIESFIR